MYKKIFRNLLGLILALTVSATLAPAQVTRGMDGGFQEQFIQIKRKQLGPELGVSQQVVDQLLQIEQRYKAMRQKLIQDSKEDFKRLHQIIPLLWPLKTDTSAWDQEVRGVLTNIKRNHQEVQSLHQRQIQEEEKLLTPVQLARNIMYHKKLLREAQSIKGRSSRKTAPLPPPSATREIQVSRKTALTREPAGAYQEMDENLMGFQQAELEKALGVNRQMVAQLLHIRQRYGSWRQQSIQEAKNEFQRLEQVMRQQNPSDQEVKNILTNIRKKEQEMQGLKQRQDEEEMAILQPVQQARYLMFLISLRQQMGKEPRTRSAGPPANAGVGTSPARNAASGMVPATRPASPAEVMRPPDQTFAPAR